MIRENQIKLQDIVEEKGKTKAKEEYKELKEISDIYDL